MPASAKARFRCCCRSTSTPFAKTAADNKPEAASSDKYFGGFHPTKFFLPGPAGYDATFTLSNKEDGLKIRFEKPIVFEMSGAAFIYDLDGPDHIEKETPPPKELIEAFPGIRRILSEAHLRYVFQRFGVPYVLSIQCYDMHPSSRHLSCRRGRSARAALFEVAAHGRRHAGKNTGAEIRPQPAGKAKSDFTYYGPGDLIENTGWKKMPGRTDHHVYARMRFPIAHAPAYVKSQSFLPWGDCYRTGMSGAWAGRARRTTARSTTSRWCSMNWRR